MKWAFIFVAALTVAADDSPLVQAAKEAKKPKDKPAAIVITNATVKQSKAKLSTTKSQRALKLDAKKAPANDCVMPVIAPAPPIAVAAAPDKKPQVDDAEIEAIMEGLSMVPVSKFPPGATSTPQLSPNISVPQAATSTQKP